MKGRLTVTEAANILGVSRARVHAMIKAGIFKAERVGNILLLKEKDVRERAANPPPAHRPKKS